MKTKYECEICGRSYGDAQTARDCDRQRASRADIFLHYPGCPCSFQKP